MGKRKRIKEHVGAMDVFLKKMNAKEPPIKRRKVELNADDDVKADTAVICKTCQNVICEHDDANKAILIQTHADEHFADKLSKQINIIPSQQRMSNKNVKKSKKKKKKKAGIMKY